MMAYCFQDCFCSYSKSMLLKILSSGRVVILAGWRNYELFGLDCSNRRADWLSPNLRKQLVDACACYVGAILTALCLLFLRNFFFGFAGFFLIGCWLRRLLFGLRLTFFQYLLSNFFNIFFFLLSFKFFFLRRLVFALLLFMFVDSDEQTITITQDMDNLFTKWNQKTVFSDPLNAISM